MKHDGWAGLTSIQKDLMMLRYGGRACLLPSDWEGPTDEKRLEVMKTTYFPILDQLQELWKEKGNEPDFFDRYYVPKAIELTAPYLPK